MLDNLLKRIVLSIASIVKKITVSLRIAYRGEMKKIEPQNHKGHKDFGDIFGSAQRHSPTKVRLFCHIYRLNTEIFYGFHAGNKKLA
jgi:hypothetical protein